MIDIGVINGNLGVAAIPVRKFTTQGNLTNFLDFFTRQRHAAKLGLVMAHLETVEFRRVMARRHHRTTIGLEVINGKIHYRRRYHPDVDYVTPTRLQPRHQCRRKRRRRQARIVPDHDFFAATPPKQRPRCLPQHIVDRFTQFLPYHTPNIICPKNGRIDGGHRFLRTYRIFINYYIL